jgi:hypothetical protein
MSEATSGMSSNPHIAVSIIGSAFADPSAHAEYTADFGDDAIYLRSKHTGRALLLQRNRKPAEVEVRDNSQLLAA